MTRLIADMYSPCHHSRAGVVNMQCMILQMFFMAESFVAIRMRALDSFVVWKVVQVHKFEMGSQSVEVAKRSLAGFRFQCSISKAKDTLCEIASHRIRFMLVVAEVVLISQRRGLFQTSDVRRARPLTFTKLDDSLDSV